MPRFVASPTGKISVDFDTDLFVVNTRVAQMQPHRTRASIAQGDLERVCAAAGSDHQTVRRRTVDHLGLHAVPEES